MNTKRNIALTGLALALGATVLVTAGAGGGGKEAFKLEGSWMAKNIYGQSYIYTFAPSDPSGRQAAFHGSFVDAEPTLGGALPPDSYLTPFIGQAEMAGPDEAKFTVIWYTVAKVAGAPQKVLIGMDSGTIKKTGPGKAEVSHSSSFYWPGQDANGDGLPDTGQAPFLCVTLTSLDTRLPILPPCQP